MGRYYEGAKLVKKTRRDKASGKIRKSKFYYLRYKSPESGKPVYESTGAGDIEEAEAFREERLRELRAGVLGTNLPTNRVAIAQVWDDYGRHLASASAIERLSYSIVPILGFWKEQPVSSINVESVKKYADLRRTKGKSNWTIRRELSDLRAAVNHAQVMMRMQPFNFPKLPPKGKSRVRFLLRDEVAALLRAARTKYRSSFTLRLFILIGYHTGARKEAIISLRWDQIDFQLNRMNFGADIGNKARANIPIPQSLKVFLLARFRKYGDRAEYVFHQKRDPTRRVESIDKGFRNAVQRAQLEDVTPHTLRHTRVSELVQEGYSIKAISKYMAMSPETILTVYAHTADEEIEEIARNTGRSPKVRRINEKAREKPKKKVKTRQDKETKIQEKQ